MTQVFSDLLPSPDSLAHLKTFLGVSHTVVRPEAIYRTEHEWLILLLLSTLVVFAVINYLVPGKIWKTILFPFNYKAMLTELNDQFIITSGIVIPLLFFFNFIIATTTLVYIIYYNALPHLMIDFGERNLFFTIALFILIFLLLNRLFIFTVNGILEKPTMARLHIRINYFAEATAGMVLTFLLTVYFYTDQPFILTAGLLILFVLLTYKWIVLLILGIKLTNVHLLHLFLYLCTLEIAPVLLVLKWLGNNVYQP